MAILLGPVVEPNFDGRGLSDVHGDTLLSAKTR